MATSPTPAVRAAHREMLAMVSATARHDPDAGHVSITSGEILAVIPACDAIVTDVSSVGLDWLYLRTERPIFLTDRHHDAERLRREVPVSRCADVIDEVEVGSLAARIADRLEHDEHRLARVAMRHHYFDDLQIGDSTARFLNAVDDLVRLRDRLLGTVPATDGETAHTA